MTKNHRNELKILKSTVLSRQFYGEQDHMDDTYAINLAKSRFREGFNKADAEMVLSIYDCAFSDMSFGLPSFFDSDAKDVLRARLRQLFRDYTAEMAVVIIDIVLNGDKALDWGWHVLKLTDKRSGTQREIRTRYFETWKRNPDRGWVITSFIDNLDELPRLPDDVIRQLEQDSCDSSVTRLVRERSQSFLPGRL